MKDLALWLIADLLNARNIYAATQISSNARRPSTLKKRPHATPFSHTMSAPSIRYRTEDINVLSRKSSTALHCVNHF